MDQPFLKSLYQITQDATWQPLLAAAAILSSGFALVFLILFAKSWTKFVFALVLLIITLIFVKITTRRVRPLSN